MRTNFSRNSIYFQKKRIQTRETKNSLERYRKRRVATLKHTSFASPLDSILFRDSTHSSHFAQPLGTSGTSIPPFTSRSTDTDVPTSAALASPPPLPFSFPFIRFTSCTVREHRKRGMERQKKRKGRTKAEHDRRADENTDYTRLRISGQ